MSQLNDDEEEKVIQFGSRVLGKEERRHSTTKKELAAIIWGLKKYKPYLIGAHFKVRSDHKLLSGLIKTKDPEGQLGRWLDILGEFDFEILYRPGKQHSNADGMSQSCVLIEFLNELK